MDDKTFDRFFRENHLRACRFACGLVGEGEAEDAVQEVFLRLYRRREKIDASTLSAYFYRSLTNHCLNRLRRRKGWARIRYFFKREERQPMVVNDDPAETWERLSPLEKTLFLLMDYLGKTTEETLEILKIAPSTLRVVRHRMRKKIKQWEENHVSL